MANGFCQATYTSWKASRLGGLTISRMEMIYVERKRKKNEGANATARQEHKKGTFSVSTIILDLTVGEKGELSVS